VGREAARQVAEEVGVVGDPQLQAYVAGIGHRLLRAAPRRPFDYQFQVVDQLEPNAFALPGGYIFISRGLLVLANDEDELACVIGHEITHAVRRHAARQQAIARHDSPLAMPWVKAATRAAYSRDMEREADQGGQILAAAAGYDPMGMATFLRRLESYGRLQTAEVREPFFLDSHPGARERAAVNKVRAQEIRWRRDPRLGDTRLSLLRHIDGLEVAQRPEAGIFQGSRFLHPDLGFQISFPFGWQTANTRSTVGARSPRGDAVVFLTAAGPARDPRAAAEELVKQSAEEAKAEVSVSEAVALAVGRGWRLELLLQGGRVGSLVTFLPWRGSLWRITGMARARDAGRFRGRWVNTARSFRPLRPEQRRAIHQLRLRLARARPGEGLLALARRTHNAWDPARTALNNGIFVSHRFQGGERVKIAVREPYRPHGESLHEGSMRSEPRFPSTLPGRR